MARILVTYYTRSGTTGEMAELVAEAARGVDGAEVELKVVDDVDAKALDAYDGIVVGSPTYYGLMAAKIKDLFDESVALHGKLDGVVGGAFTSAANLGGGNESTILSILTAMIVHGMIVQGNPKLDHYGPVALGGIDDRARTTCDALGRRVAELAVKLYG